MAVLKDLLLRIAIRIISTYFAIITLLGMLIRRYKNGSEYFKIKTRDKPPALLNDPRWGTHRYVQLPKQRIRIHYVEKGSRDKPLLLCVHGFPECWFSMRSILEHLSDDYWVVAMDMRGYGGSDRPTGLSSYETDILVEDIRELIQILGRDKCNLVAHDWGGVLAWMVTSKYPEMFHKHISLNGPHFQAMKDHLFTSLSQLRKSWYVAFFQTPYVPELVFSAGDFAAHSMMFKKTVSGKKASDEELEVYKYYFSQKDGFTGPINYYRNLNFGEDEVWKNRRCKVESLIIWATQDMALDNDIVEQTFRYCDDLKVHYVNDSGHFILNEKPDECNTVIRKFLKSE